MNRYESKGFSRAELAVAAQEHDFHPAVVDALRWFVDDEHLPWNLVAVNNSFGELAMHLAVSVPRQTETTHCLRSLLAAKDCAVRAFIREEEDENAVPIENVELPLYDDGGDVDVSED